MFETTTPDTLDFLILGLAVVGGIVGLYVVSLWLRFANARKDIVLLENLQDD